MKKLLVLLGVVLTVSACDSEIDITKYPETIQNCYNTIYYEDINCNKGKTILKYCQCFMPKSIGINQRIEKTWNMGLKNIYVLGGLNSERERMLDKAAEECSKNTGYIFIADCPTKKVPETMDME